MSGQCTGVASHYPPDAPSVHTGTGGLSRDQLCSTCSRHWLRSWPRRRVDLSTTLDARRSGHRGAGKSGANRVADALRQFLWLITPSTLGGSSVSHARPVTMMRKIKATRPDRSRRGRSLSSVDCSGQRSDNLVARPACAYKQSPSARLERIAELRGPFMQHVRAESPYASTTK
jgi:hypothetical protein